MAAIWAQVQTFERNGTPVKHNRAAKSMLRKIGVTLTLLPADLNLELIL
jgi:hypothetical protein